MRTSTPATTSRRNRPSPGRKRAVNASRLDAATVAQTAAVLDRLPGMERTVLEARFGLNTGHPASRADIAREHSITVREVAEIEGRGLVHLRETADRATLTRLLSHLTR